MDWPEKLVEDIARRRCVLFLGSGVSANSTNVAGERPKSWAAVLEHGITKLTEGVNKKKITTLKKNNKKGGFVISL